MIKVHSYESMGTFDGPGLRLVVFLQGCNFRCLYCANPDTIDACGGTPTSPDEILRMAVDQKPFYGRRGGVTFSGGEPTFQAAALAPLVRRLREAGIHVCIDTNGSIWNPAVEELLGLADLILLDVKQADPERHLAPVSYTHLDVYKRQPCIGTLERILAAPLVEASGALRPLHERSGAQIAVHEDVAADGLLPRNLRRIVLCGPDMPAPVAVAVAVEQIAHVLPDYAGAHGSQHAGAFARQHVVLTRCV